MYIFAGRQEAVGREQDAAGCPCGPLCIHLRLYQNTQLVYVLCVSLQGAKRLLAESKTPLAALVGRYVSTYDSIRKRSWWDLHLSGGTIVEQVCLLPVHFANVQHGAHDCAAMTLGAEPAFGQLLGTADGMCDEL